MKWFYGLSEQLVGNPFRPMLFSIYNVAEEENYVAGLKRQGFEYGIEDLECLVFNTEDINEEEMLAFKSYIEDELQGGNVVVGVIIIKGKKTAMAALKPKKVDVVDVLDKR